MSTPEENSESCEMGFGMKNHKKMNYSLGVPKGMRVVLEERGIDTRKMNADKTLEVLGSHATLSAKNPELNGFWWRRRGTLCTCCLNFTVN